MLEQTIVAHAVACAPRESCGYVVSTGQGKWHYLPCENRAIEPDCHFSMTPEDYLEATALGQVMALVHSHPDGTPYLSSADRQLQIKTALPWWLVCNGKLRRYSPVPLLLGRHFVPITTDCYALLRDAYHLAGIALPEMSYPTDWFHQGMDLYCQEFPGHGFYRAPWQQAQPGDVLLCCYGSAVANHAAIYCGEGALLHHIPNQLSKRERYDERWQRRTHSLWRHRDWCASAFTGICNDLAVVTPWQ